MNNLPIIQLNENGEPVIEQLKLLEENEITITKYYKGDNISIDEIMNEEKLYNNLKNNLKKFRKDAFRHLKYLKVILFILMLYLYDNKYYDVTQFWITVFIILFQLAFVQNMLNNLQERIKI